MSFFCVECDLKNVWTQKKTLQSGLNTAQMINFDNNNNNNVVDELRTKVNKLNEEMKNASNNSYSLSLLFEINKVEQDAKAQQQKLKVDIFICCFFHIARNFG